MPPNSPHPFTHTTILGFGSFGKLAAEHLAPHTQLAIIDPSASEADVQAQGAQLATSEESAHKAIASSNAVILAVPVQAIESVCKAIAPHLTPGTLVADVCSVKIKPAQWMAELLPTHCAILATHPCFGRETAKELGTFADQPIACCDIQHGSGAETDLLAAAREFLSSTLKLAVIDCTPDVHDQQMAYVQVLTHLIGHAAHELQLPDLPTATLAYRYLLQMQHNTERDSPQLFEAIQHLNPHAAEARARFKDAIDTVLAKAEPRAEPES